MTWLIASAIFVAVLGAAWRVDVAIKRKKKPSKRVRYGTYRDRYKAADWFSDAKSYRRPPPR